VNTKLNECPFCGEEARLVINGAWEGGGYVECLGCGATTGPKRTTPEAVDAWNERAPVSAPTAGERQSIADDTEFQELAGELWNAGSYNESMEKPMNALVAYVDTLLRAGRSAGDAVPAGFKLAPDEPTPKMLAEGLERFQFAERIGMPEYSAEDAMSMAYEAMLSAAPVADVKADAASRSRAEGGNTSEESSFGAAPESAAPIAIITGLMGSSNSTVPVKIEWAESAAPVVQPEKARHLQARTWQPITKPGQVRKGDKLRFKIGDQQYHERAKLILESGTDKEEVVYNIRENFYFITSMVIGGRSSHKSVEFFGSVERDSANKGAKEQP
jgi:Lar family restriction alleviation protein